jgi:hypothetical protein
VLAVGMTVVERSSIRGLQPLLWQWLHGEPIDFDALLADQQQAELSDEDQELRRIMAEWDDVDVADVEVPSWF